MDADKLVAALERFFLDIIGLLIPGAAFLVGLWALFTPVRLAGGATITAPTSTAGWWLAAGVAYAIGHGLSTLGDTAVLRPAVRVLTWLAKLLRRPLPAAVKSRDALLSQIGGRRSVLMFARKQWCDWRGDEALIPRDVRDLRNSAMTLARVEDRATVLRLMHIAMLNLGMATAVWLLGATRVAQRLLDAVILGGEFDRWFALRLAGELLIIALGAVFISAPFLVRHFEFYDRAMRLPFDVVAAMLNDSGSAGASAQLPSVARSAPVIAGERPPVSGTPAVGPQSVYLSGGHRSGWQDRVMAAVPDFDYRDPRAHGLTDSAAYTAWDLEAVRASDIVFAYFERENPSGFGLTLEVGYAAALGKHVILIDEKSASSDDLARHLRILRSTATVTFDTLEDGLDYLSKLHLLAPRSAVGANGAGHRSAHVLVAGQRAGTAVPQPPS